MNRLHPDILRIPLAHRGYHDAKDDRPENSPAAFRAAIDAGYGIELDVQLTSDNRAVVFHDYVLDRLTREKGLVRDRSVLDLATTRLNGTREGIPSLEDVLGIVAGKVPLLIEIKDQDGQMGPNVGPLEEAVAEALQDYDGPVAVMSYNPNSVSRMASLAPGVPRGIVTEGYPNDHFPQLPETTRTRLRDIADFDLVSAEFISHDATDLDRPRVAELKAQRVPILCWTVRSAEQEAQARKVADNVTFEGYPAAIPVP